MQPSDPMPMDTLTPPLPPVDLGSAENSRLHQAFIALRDGLSETIVGQSALVERLLIALLADGHLLVEGPPGLAKTSAVQMFPARECSATFCPSWKEAR